MNIEKIEQNIGYTFKNKDLLKTALTHTSYAHENKVESNEKLEFLGDSILEFVTSNYLYNNYKKLKEGEMTKVRASVVCEKSLHQVALKHNFSDFLKLGKSEIACNGNKKPAILADSVEAVIAAIYQDSNIQNAEKFIIENLKEPVKNKEIWQEIYKMTQTHKVKFIKVKGHADNEFNNRCDELARNAIKTL